MKDKIAIKIVNAAGKLLAENCSEGETALVYDGEYCQGDVILVELSEVPAHYWVQLDDAREKSLVYLTGNVSYVIPFGDARLNISPKAFCGAKHLLTVRKARTYEVESYRNLALNVWDQHHMNNMYPHAYANVETRGEAVFAAQNAIDGVVVNNSHGEWPYASWGINQQEDAQITVDFGRDIETDRIILYTRADFPHDNWWEAVTLSFSDGSDIRWELEKSSRPHEITFPAKRVKRITMHDMKKSDDPSPFPALTQIEVYGREI
ncbi:MAG: carbohydrate-binding protein [Lachnospiraceae bacterium]|nr:carbohydrate-binding protein [Lachnospiraceae bacterium]